MNRSLLGLLAVCTCLAPVEATASSVPAHESGAAADQPGTDVHTAKHSEHYSWFTIVCGPECQHALKEKLAHTFGEKTYLDGKPVVEEAHFSHVFFAFVAFVIVLGFALAARRKLDSDPDAGVLPSRKWSPLLPFEVVVGAVWNLMRNAMPLDEARRHFPIVGTLALYIFVMNFLGTIPLGAPATDNLNTNIGMALTVFFATHISGIRAQGIVNYAKHFMGPMLGLAPLMLLIEIVSHLVRPVSLSLRLLGNMVGDHKVMEIFLGFHIPLLPLPLMALGLLVVVIQTLVFVLLSTMYLGAAVALHDDHDDHAHAEPGAAGHAAAGHG